MANNPDKMDILKKILNGVLLTLFIEAILFLPAVIMVATLGDLTRTIKYLIPFLLALLPYIVMRKTKATTRRLNIIVLVLALLVSICFLIFFSGLTLISCAGHPPY